MRILEEEEAKDGLKLKPLEPGRRRQCSVARHHQRRQRAKRYKRKATANEVP